MAANGVESFENVRYDIIGDMLVVSYEEPKVRPKAAFAGVAFTIGDIVLFKHLNSDAKKVLDRYGKIWRCGQFPSGDRFFLTPLKPSLQGKFKGTATAKQCTSYQLAFAKVKDPNYVCMAVHPFLGGDFHWKMFE